MKFIRNIINKILAEIKYRKRLRRLRKNDPFTYK